MAGPGPLVEGAAVIGKGGGGGGGKGKGASTKGKGPAAAAAAGNAPPRCFGFPRPPHADDIFKKITGMIL